jgi:hypothetical protein
METKEETVDKSMLPAPFVVFQNAAAPAVGSQDITE